MKKIFFIYFLIFSLNCKKEVKPVNILLINSNNFPSSNYINFLNYSKIKKYKLKIYTGNLFSLTNKSFCSYLNKLNINFFVPYNKIEKIDLKKIKKYEKRCNFPLVYTENFKLTGSWLKPYFLLKLLNYRILVYNYHKMEKLNFNEFSKMKLKDNDLIIIFTSIKDLITPNKENILKIFFSKELEENYSVIFINPEIEGIYEIKIYYEKGKILKKEIYKLL